MIVHCMAWGPFFFLNRLFLLFRSIHEIQWKLYIIDWQKIERNRIITKKLYVEVLQIAYCIKTSLNVSGIINEQIHNYILLPYGESSVLSLPSKTCIFLFQAWLKHQWLPLPCWCGCHTCWSEKLTLCYKYNVSLLMFQLMFHFVYHHNLEHCCI